MPSCFASSVTRLMNAVVIAWLLLDATFPNFASSDFALDYDIIAQLRLWQQSYRCMDDNWLYISLLISPDRRLFSLNSLHSTTGGNRPNLHDKMQHCCWWGTSWKCHQNLFPISYDLWFAKSRPELVCTILKKAISKDKETFVHAERCFQNGGNGFPELDTGLY